MFLLKKYNNFLNDTRMADLLPYLSYDDTSGMYYLDNNQIGYIWYCQPIKGIGLDTIRLLQTIFSGGNYPEGTVIQFQIYFNPYIDHLLNNILTIRKTTANNILFEMFKNKVKFFKNDIQEIMLRDIQLYISLCIPLTKTFSRANYESLKKHVEKNLKIIGLMPKIVTPKKLITYLSNIFNCSFPFEQQITNYSPNIEIKNQIIRNENIYKINKNEILVNDKVIIKTLTPKQYPEEFYLPDMDTLLGDFFSDFRVINTPFLLTFSFVFIDQNKYKKNFLKKYSTINYQMIGPMPYFVPKIKFKKENYDIFYSEIEKNSRTIMKCSLSLVLFDYKEKINDIASMIEGLYKTKNFKMNVDHYITLPIFLSSMLLNYDVESMEKFQKLITITDLNAANFSPIIADWKGTGNPVLNFVSRRGQLVQFDIFDSPGGKNGCIIAKTGSGKSFFANEIIVSYLSLGAKVYVIDVGRSYEKLSEMLDGEFIVFSKEKEICINPFSNITNISDDMELLKVIIEVMAVNDAKLTPLQRSFLEESIRTCYDKYNSEFGVDELVKELRSSDDKRKQDVGQMLFGFSREGALGKWVNGQNNLEFNKNFVVLELEELKSMKHLQNVVLTSIISLIERDIYLGDRSIPKLVIIDEAWDLLENPNTAHFIETASRRFRKYGAGIFVITQGVNDLYKNQYTKAIFENSDFIFMLWQKPESIELIKNEKKLSLSDYEFEILKTVKTIPGLYSEIFCYTSLGKEIVRLYVDRFSQFVYSTTPQEIARINKYREQGLDIVNAIKKVMEDEKQKGVA